MNPISSFRAKCALLSLGAMLLVAPSCSKNSKSQKDNQDSAQVAVETAIVQQGSIDNIGSFTASVQAQATNEIVPQTGGRIRQIKAEVGQQVSRGQILAVMDNSQLSQAEVQLADAKLAYSRTDELYKVGGVSKAQWDARKSALAVAETAHRNLQENTYLRSPISGVVTKRNYDTGDMCSPSLPIFVVEQISPVKLLINVSERYYTQVKKGMPARVHVDALGTDEVFEGKIALIHPTLNAQTHTFDVEVEIPNKDQKLRPGMYANVEIDFGQATAVMVSDRAVVKTPGSGEYYVYMLENGKAVRTIVKVGRQVEDQYEIISGLTPGTTVITEGAQVVRNGEQVKVVKKASSK